MASTSQRSLWGVGSIFGGQWYSSQSSKLQLTIPTHRINVWQIHVYIHYTKPSKLWGHLPFWWILMNHEAMSQCGVGDEFADSRCLGQVHPRKGETFLHLLCQCRFAHWMLGRFPRCFKPLNWAVNLCSGLFSLHSRGWNPKDPF